MTWNIESIENDKVTQWKLPLTDNAKNDVGCPLLLEITVCRNLSLEAINLAGSELILAAVARVVHVVVCLAIRGSACATKKRYIRIGSEVLTEQELRLAGHP